MVVPASVKGPFLKNHFNDVLFIPAALPVLVWAHWKLGLRREEGPPTPGEVAFHWVLWSLTVEGLAPLLSRRATADLWDVVAYGVGGLLASGWWQRRL